MVDAQSKKRNVPEKNRLLLQSDKVQTKSRAPRGKDMTFHERSPPHVDNAAANQRTWTPTRRPTGEHEIPDATTNRWASVCQMREWMLLLFSWPDPGDTTVPANLFFRGNSPRMITSTKHFRFVHETPTGSPPELPPRFAAQDCPQSVRRYVNRQGASCALNHLDEEGLRQNYDHEDFLLQGKAPDAPRSDASSGMCQLFSPRLAVPSRKHLVPGCVRDSLPTSTSPRYRRDRSHNVLRDVQHWIVERRAMFRS